MTKKLAPVDRGLAKFAGVGLEMPFTRISNFLI